VRHVERAAQLGRASFRVANEHIKGIQTNSKYSHKTSRRVLQTDRRIAKAEEILNHTHRSRSTASSRVRFANSIWPRTLAFIAIWVRLAIMKRFWTMTQRRRTVEMDRIIPSEPVSMADDVKEYPLVLELCWTLRLRGLLS
jgi:hypothetical protein